MSVIIFWFWVMILAFFMPFHHLFFAKLPFCLVFSLSKLYQLRIYLIFWSARSTLEVFKLILREFKLDQFMSVGTICQEINIGYFSIKYTLSLSH